MCSLLTCTCLFWPTLTHVYFGRFAELETPSPDKYNNRGGSLLQSQKEAAKISKEIPKIESRVLAEVDKTIGEVSLTVYSQHVTLLIW